DTRAAAAVTGQVAADALRTEATRAVAAAGANAACGLRREVKHGDLHGLRRRIDRKGLIAVPVDVAPWRDLRGRVLEEHGRVLHGARRASVGGAIVARALVVGGALLAVGKPRSARRAQAEVAAHAVRVAGAAGRARRPGGITRVGRRASRGAGRVAGAGP